MYFKIRKNLSLFSFVTLLAVPVFFLTNCANSSDNTDTTDSTGTSSGGTSVTLNASDFPSLGVCSGSTDVTSAAFKAAVASANSFTFLHKAFVTDADIPFICGKDGGWDPADAGAFSDSNSSILFPDTTTSLIQGTRGSVMICNTGFDFTELDFGFHDATTFRGEFTFTDGAVTYQARFRFTVSGADAGTTLASLGLTNSDLSVTDGNDNPMTTATDIFNLLAASPTSINLKVKAAGVTRITATGGIICAKTI